MKLKPAGKLFHYTAGVVFIGTGVLFLYFTLTGSVDGDQFLWFGVFYLAWGFFYLLVVYVRPQWFGITVQ